jgi:hypothetical protein
MRCSRPGSAFWELTIPTSQNQGHDSVATSPTEVCKFGGSNRGNIVVASFSREASQPEWARDTRKIDAGSGKCRSPSRHSKVRQVLGTLSPCAARVPGHNGSGPGDTTLLGTWISARRCLPGRRLTTTLHGSGLAPGDTSCASACRRRSRSTSTASA